MKITAARGRIDIEGMRFLGYPIFEGLILWELSKGDVPAGIKPEEIMATLEKLGDLKSKGILTQEEFDAKKAELLKKLV